MPEYRRTIVVADSDRGSRWYNGSPWRDPDVLHVMLVGAVATLLSAGIVYIWFLFRTWRVAAIASCDAGDAASAIVFGKRLRGGRPDREFRWRLRHALRLMRKHARLRVLLAGGMSGSADGPSEAQAGQRWLMARAPEMTDRLLVEERSRDTVDNLREARNLLPPGPVALVSNRYHLARCELLARSLGVDARICAAEPALRFDRWLARRLVLEAGYHMLFAIGHRWARLTGNTRILSRVS